MCVVNGMDVVPNRLRIDKYPLVVRLPCNSEHVFDLECIGPWLKLNPTCPLDRKNFVKKEVDPKETADGTDAHQDEADWDNTYA